MSGSRVLRAIARHGPRLARLPPPPGELALPVAVLSAGYEVRKYGYDWDNQRRGTSPVALFQYTLAGEGRLAYEGREVAIPPGTALVVHWPHPSRYYTPSGGRWEFA